MRKRSCYSEIKWYYTTIKKPYAQKVKRKQVKKMTKVNENEEKR